MDNEDFAIRLLRAKSKAGKTQAQLADDIGTNRSVICHLESGKTTPSYKILIGIALSLGVSTDYLCGLKEEPT